jgi:hypothetical protein
MNASPTGKRLARPILPSNLLRITNAPGSMMQIVPIHRRFWWPHPYAREAGLLWRKLVIRYRYFVDGHEISL